MIATMQEQEKSRAKVRWASLSVASNTALVVFKLAVGILGGSVSIIAEAVHSLNDLVAAVIAFAAVRKSAQPPDEDHAWGHGKYENLSGLIESALIIFAGVVIVWQSIVKIRNPGEIRLLDLGIAVMLVSAAVNFFVSRKLVRVARETDSIAIETDGAHLLVDVYTSLGVMGGLVLIRLTGWTVLDPVISICVALYIVWLGISLSVKSGKDLLDEQLPRAEVEAIEKILGDRSNAIASYHKLATRKSGGTRMIDVHIQVHGDETVRDAPALAHHIEDDINALYPGARVMTHVEPCDAACRDCKITDCPDDKRPAAG